ncbi:MAG: hypothetical protein KGI25_04520 [Thaumarchaeota archaeon]|nr:hypothetical protein [Nitrososphaerota archaeon]
MTDDQCQALIDSVNKLTEAVEIGADKIADAVDGIYFSSNDGLEKRLDRLIEEFMELNEYNHYRD